MGKRVCLMALAVCTLASQSAQAGEPETEPAGQAEASATAGVRAFIDPATGELREPLLRTPSAAFEQGPRAPDFTRMREERLPDGTVLLHTNGQVRTVSLVRMNPDGTFASTCEALPAPPEEAP